MHRFFIPPDRFGAERPVISGPDVRHMVKVLRLGPGDVVELLDGTGRAARARINSVGREEVSLIRLEEFTPEGEPPLKVTLVQGLAKGEKMDLVIQKSTELGVAEIIPLVCRRSVVRLEGDRVSGRHDRWQRVAAEAARQCRRARIPRVRRPQSLEEVLAEIPDGTVSILPWEEERDRPLGHMLPLGRPAGVYLFIGPEGGFESSEVEKARQRGVVTVTLGPRILRTETAGLACLSIIMHRYGDLG
ncbi:MAG: 16S rRNA (uracil(1498)-N(3))-methyltransferase [Peptococcaceae bacterium]|nr:16S rRNA (uracil(1498)-N(3))-methyltransferase [Peptococcaceae bacterium]